MWFTQQLHHCWPLTIFQNKRIKNKKHKNIEEITLYQSRCAGLIANYYFFRLKQILLTREMLESSGDGKSYIFEHKK